MYISNLPGNATLQKVEAILEMDADCGVDETCLMKVQCVNIGFDALIVLIVLIYMRWHIKYMKI